VSSDGLSLFFNDGAVVFIAEAFGPKVLGWRSLGLHRESSQGSWQAPLNLGRL